MWNTIDSIAIALQHESIFGYIIKCIDFSNQSPWKMVLAILHHKPKQHVETI